jgi:hypothetical protein
MLVITMGKLWVSGKGEDTQGEKEKIPWENIRNFRCEKMISGCADVEIIIQN